MTSQERHEARYRRRKAARDARRMEQLEDALEFDKVFTFIRLYRSAQKCFRGVSWKASVQAYKAKCGINVAKRLMALRSGVFRLKHSPEFTTRERGHERHINSIHIEDRVPEKCNSFYALKPVLQRGLLWDNYASQEGKGTTRARDRLHCHLERHIRRYGFTGGMIIFDFKGFFDSIPHGLVLHVLKRNFADLYIIGMNMRIIRHKRKEKGLVLGSENSQDFAISTPNALDHYVKETLGAEAYGRYMDDGWIIHPDMEYLRGIYRQMKIFAAGLGFTINERKSRIIPFGRPFTMLKRKYSFTATGGIIMRPARESVIRERRKLKRLHRRMLKGTMEAKAGWDSLNAWKSSLRGCRSRKIEMEMDRLYTELFITRWLNGQEA